MMKIIKENKILKTICIAAPVYNEEDGIQEFLRELDKSVQVIANSGKYVIEIFFMNDGSKDKTISLIKNFQFTNFDKITIKNLSNNYGHTGAVTAIVDQVNVDMLILMDADLQDEPGIIPELVDNYEQGHKSVRVVRGKRGEGKFFQIFSSLYYCFFNYISGLPSNMGTFGLYSKEVVIALRSYPEKIRYLPGLVSKIGFKTSYVICDRKARFANESRVGLRNLIKLAFIGALSFSSIPLHLVTMLGFLTASMAFISGIAIVGVKIFTVTAIPGWASTMSTQFFFGGMILLSLGIIGEYIGLIYEEVKARPLYTIDHDSSITIYKNKEIKNEKLCREAS